MALAPNWTAGLAEQRATKALEIDLAEDRLLLSAQLRRIRTLPLRLGAQVLGNMEATDVPECCGKRVGRITTMNGAKRHTPGLTGVWIRALAREEIRARDWPKLERYLSHAALTTPAFLGFGSVGALNATLESVRSIWAERSRLYEPARAPIVPVYEGYPGITDNAWAVGMRRMTEVGLPFMVSLHQVRPDADTGGQSLLLMNQLQLATEPDVPEY